MVPTLAIVLAVAQNAPGQVTFDDVQDLHPIPPLPQTMRSPMPSLPPPAPQAPGEGGDDDPWKPRFGVYRNPDGSYTADHGSFIARVDRGGRVTFQDRAGFTAGSAWGVVGALGLVGTFGNQEPNYRHKQYFLERTFDERLSMRADDDARVMHAALANLPAYLAAIWHYDPWSVTTRKRVLFELWDECAELGSADLREAGAAARAIIDEFIRRYVPEDGEYAYTVAELRALNAERTSAHAFDPYGTVLMSAAGGTDDDATVDLDSRRLHPAVRMW